MTIDGYQASALRTADKCNRSLVNCALGLTGEAGEFADALKKEMYQGHERDAEALAEELGDIAWYVAVAAHVLGYSLEEILLMNVAKLRARYPDGFDAARSVNRQARG